MKNFISRWMWTCPCCGWLVLNELGLCRFCWSKLQATRLGSGHLNLAAVGHPLFALWDWGSHNDHSLRQFLMSLKLGRGRSQMWNYLSWALVAQFRLGGREENNLVVVPSPPRSKGVLDHAGRLAKGMAKATDWPFKPILFREKISTLQKHRSRRDRFSSGVGLKANFKSGKPFTNVLFIDDVVTTGATSHSAWLALGCPSSFYVGVIAHRLSCNRTGEEGVSF